MSVSETEAGRELVAEWHHIDTCLIEWILKLAEFDADALWAVDGFNSCQSWLEIKCQMARATAFDKVRVAAELTRRPVVREAFAAGRLPYSKARALTRLDGVDEERDEKFVADAVDTSVRILENPSATGTTSTATTRHPTSTTTTGCAAYRGSWAATAKSSSKRRMTCSTASWASSMPTATSYGMTGRAN